MPRCVSPAIRRLGGLVRRRARRAACVGPKVWRGFRVSVTDVVAPPRSPVRRVDDADGSRRDDDGRHERHLVQMRVDLVRAGREHFLLDPLVARIDHFHARRRGLALLAGDQADHRLRVGVFQVPVARPIATLRIARGDLRQVDELRVVLDRVDEVPPGAAQLLPARPCSGSRSPARRSDPAAAARRTC